MLDFTQLLTTLTLKELLQLSIDVDEAIKAKEFKPDLETKIINNDN